MKQIVEVGLFVVSLLLHENLIIVEKGHMFTQAIQRTSTHPSVAAAEKQEQIRLDSY